jgi:protein arginine N-methyltransferase 1
MANESFLMSFHRDLLSDTDTQSRFRQAIRGAVREGDVVVDLGAGTGVHAVFACEAGASRVYAVENDRIIDLAREIVDRNGCGDRVVFVEGSSTEVEIPERADVLVANLGFDSTLRYLPDARDRFLPPGGRMIPSSMELIGAPVESPDSHARDVAFWKTGCHGVDLEPMWKVAVNTVHVDRFDADQLISNPQTLVRAEMEEVDGSRISGRATWLARRSGSMHGLASWYVQHLDDETDVSLAPPLRLPYPLWQHCFFPLREPVRIEEGDRVEVEIRLAPFVTAGTYMTWEVAIEGRDGAVASRHSTFEGTPLSREALERQLPQYRPSLSSRGDAARTVLDLVADGRTLESIEAETFKRYPTLFREVRDAAAFISKVLRDYGA